MLRLISCAAVVCVVCQCSTASALVIFISGIDPVANLSASGHDWMNARESPVYLPVSGCWCNGAGHFYFAGATADLNAFLERTSQAADSENVHASYRHVSCHVVIHPGAGYVSDHSRKTRAQWKLELLRSSERGPGESGFIRDLTINVHVWIDDTIRLEDLTVPATFSVASGGEIERFVQENSRQPAP